LIRASTSVTEGKSGTSPSVGISKPAYAKGNGDKDKKKNYESSQADA
jgi:hypothetical protein